MLKKHMAAYLVATAFAAAPAFAQTSTTSPSGATDRPAATGSGSTTTGSPAMQPATPSPSSGSSMSSSSSGSSAMNQSGQQGQTFMTQMQADHMMASDLIGTRVISSNNESIGDINDVIVDRNGQAIAAVIGVGGFLGIGEKDVAVAFSELEFATAEQMSAMNRGNNDNNVSATGSTATTGTAATGTTANGNTASGMQQNMAAAPNNNAATTGTSSSDTEPQRVILRMTKAELEAAPKFDKDNVNATGSSGAASPAANPASPAANPTGTTAPKQ